ncbi:MAG TPA: energy-coupling factor transporter ATPase [Thermoanaerobacterales bacterium]|nr:energy-coupling factor transporter ATPase [Thermoanaerobacterales bacterium]
METMIEAKNLSFAYQTSEQKITPALSAINLSVRKGEFVGIIGPNGSGKSTLAKLFNGLLLPMEGSVNVKGMDTRDSSKIWDIRQTAGMVFQNPDNQIVATIVEEDIAFGPENLGIPSDEIKRRVDEALKIVDMEEYRYHAPHLLSGGQKQRIAIAGVIAMKPECIILDEPTAMLDPAGRKEVINTVLKLNKEENITIIYITHFMDEVVFADRVIVMDAGKIVMEGAPRQVFTHVEKLKDLGLDVPQITELAYRLKSKGIKIKPGILTVDEMVMELCQI